MFETMDWQQLVSLVIVVTTAGLFLGSRFRRRKLNLTRGTQCCGCGGGGDRPSYTVVMRARKGGKPEMILKMR